MCVNSLVNFDWQGGRSMKKFVNALSLLCMCIVCKIVSCYVKFSMDMHN